jgi:transposase
VSPTWRTREELEHQLLLLAKAGNSRRAIARSLGISRNTVKKLLEAHEAGRDSGHIAIPTRPRRAPRAMKVHAHAARVAELMSTFPDITAQRVFEILREEGFDGGYTGVKKNG